MHKGTKLGPRDYWQNRINSCKREAFRSFKKLQLLKKKYSLKKQLAELETPSEELLLELAKLKELINLYYGAYRRELREWKMWTYRKQYGTKNINFVKPYIEKYGERAGFIYLIRTLEDEPIYKLGKTRNLLSRANSYNSDRYLLNSPYEFVLIQHIEECDMVERLLLEVFKEKRARGNEWFWFSDEDIEKLKRYFKHAVSNRK